MQKKLKISNFVYLIQVWAAQLKLGVGGGRLLYWRSSRRKRRRGQTKKKGENGPKISWNRRSPHPLRQKILNQIKKCETIKYGTLWNIPLYSTMSCKKCSLENNIQWSTKSFAGTLDSNNCLTILFGRSGTNFDIFCPCHCRLGSPSFVPGVLPNTENSGIPENKNLKYVSHLWL